MFTLFLSAKGLDHLLEFLGGAPIGQSSRNHEQGVGKANLRASEHICDLGFLCGGRQGDGPNPAHFCGEAEQPDGATEKAGWQANRDGLGKRDIEFERNREEMVGAPRFELGTSCSRSKRATRLRYAPTRKVMSEEW